jgi:3-methyl-2-oxobutanoate hydroxymethyltransferase
MSSKRKKITVKDLTDMKRAGEKIAMLTAYDFPAAEILDEAGIDIILVGDSLAMVALGFDNTLPVTVDAMVHHTQAVSRARPSALIIGDMPFMSYQASVADGVRNAGRLVKEGGAEAVKLEGGKHMLEIIRGILRASIPVMGHIGLTPQSIHRMGGYRVQGKSEREAGELVEDAHRLEEAGCFGMVLEGIPWQVAERITREVGIPTIGIGAGPRCDGQVLVSNDMLGIFQGFTPKFLKRYADLRSEMRKAFEEYIKEVKDGSFPQLEHSYSSTKSLKSTGDDRDD